MLDVCQTVIVTIVIIVTTDSVFFLRNILDKPPDMVYSMGRAIVLIRGDKMIILLGVSAAMILVIMLMGNDNDIDF